jgi:hypothetical protein
MKYVHGMLKAVTFSSLLVGGLMAADEKSSHELYEEGFSAIKHILAERDDFRRKVGSLEKIKSELEALLAIKGGKDESVVQKLTALKTELEDHFLAEGGAKEDNIGTVIKKISMLKKELKDLFPAQCNDSKSDVLDMLQKLSTLKNEVESLLPKQVIEQKTSDDKSQPTQAPVASDLVDRFSLLKKELCKMFPDEENKDLLARINGRIAKYEVALSGKDVDIEAMRKELMAIKKEMKEVSGYLRELARHAINNS